MHMYVPNIIYISTCMIDWLLVGNVLVDLRNYDDVGLPCEASIVVRFYHSLSKPFNTNRSIWKPMTILMIFSNAPSAALPKATQATWHPKIPSKPTPRSDAGINCEYPSAWMVVYLILINDSNAPLTRFIGQLQSMHWSRAGKTQSKSDEHIFPVERVRQMFVRSFSPLSLCT